MPVRGPYKDSVGFLCIDTEDGRRAIGTAFVVEYRDPSYADLTWTYIVTARHCIENVPSTDLYLRVNTADGVSVDIRVARRNWFLAGDSDVAIAPYGPEERHLVTAIPTTFFVDQNYRFSGPIDIPGRSKPLANPWSKEGGLPVQIGDQVYFMGLFVQSPGATKNLPIARFGAISRMPEERLSLKRFDDPNDQTYFDQRAYLVEGHSWGGQSGSPCIWTPPGLVLNIRGMTMPPNLVQGLMGIVHGHYNINILARTQEDLGRVELPVNAGIAIVTPADYILGLIQGPEVEDDRRLRAADRA